MSAESPRKRFSKMNDAATTWHSRVRATPEQRPGAVRRSDLACHPAHRLPGPDAVPARRDGLPSDGEKEAGRNHGGDGERIEGCRSSGDSPVFLRRADGFRTIPAEQLRQWIPFHDVQFLVVGREIVVDFRSLEQAKAGGTIYFSKDWPTLEIDGQKKVIGWSGTPSNAPVNAWHPAGTATWAWATFRLLRQVLSFRAKPTSTVGSWLQLLRCGPGFSENSSPGRCWADRTGGRATNGSATVRLWSRGNL